MEMFGGILYIIFCIIVGSAASNRGRSGFGYFILSLIISPLITFIILLVLGENKNIREKRIYEEAEIKETVAQKTVSAIKTADTYTISDIKTSLIYEK